MIAYFVKFYSILKDINFIYMKIFMGESVEVFKFLYFVFMWLQRESSMLNLIRLELEFASEEFSWFGNSHC